MALNFQIFFSKLFLFFNLMRRPSTGASMSPARTIGSAIATGRCNQIWIYMVATPLGSVAGTGAHVAIKL